MASLGPDGILEQQITSQAWLSRKLNMSKQFEKHGGSHEHLVTERGFNAAHLAVLTFPVPGPSVQAMSPKTQPPRPTTSSPSSEAGAPTSTLPLTRQPATSPTTPVIDQAPKANASSESRWWRMVLQVAIRAQWHAYGLLLWLVQRPAIRYLPFPFPATTNPEQWEQQIKDMVKDKSLVKKHGEKALTKECSGFRNRVGWKMAVLESLLLDGMLAARYIKGQAAQIRKEMLQEAKEEAAKLEAAGTKEQAMRQLIRPKGGLPTLKGDLLKLGALLNLDLNDQMKVEQIQEAIKPMLATLKGAATSSSSSDTVDAKVTVAAKKGAKPKTQSAPPPVLMQTLLQNLPWPPLQPQQKFKHCWHNKNCDSNP